MNEKQQFPLKIKCGSSVVTIYRQSKKSGRYDAYLVRYFRGGKAIRFTRSNFDEAYAEAQAAARNLAQGELDVTVRTDDRIKDFWLHLKRFLHHALGIIQGLISLK